MTFKFTPTEIADVCVIEPPIFRDDRGFFFESFRQQQFEDAIGYKVNFVQDNHTSSSRNVLRGMHYQVVKPQGKLVRVIAGKILDVAVDLRRSSPSFGQWVGEVLSAENRKQLWIPDGFAHGFLVLSDHAEVLYKTTEYWHKEHDRSLSWQDPDVAIKWPLHGRQPLLSPKDQEAVLLSAAELFD